MERPCHAVELTALGGFNFWAPSYTPSIPSESSRFGFIYGVYGGYDILPKIGVDLGVFRVSKKRNTGGAGNDYTSTYSDFEFPLLARFKAIPMISFGLGPYFAKLGQTVKQSGTKSSSPAPSSIQTVNRASTDFGIKADIRMEFPFTPVVSFVGDLSYNLGLKDINTSSSQKEKTTELQTLAGVQIAFETIKEEK